MRERNAAFPRLQPVVRPIFVVRSRKALLTTGGASGDESAEAGRQATRTLQHRDDHGNPGRQYGEPIHHLCLTRLRWHASDT